MKREHVIWSNDYNSFNEEEIRLDLLEQRNETRPEGYKLLPEDISDDEVSSDIYEKIASYLDDEKALLDKELPNNILIVASVAHWHGTYGAYKLLDRANLNAIFEVLQHDNQKVFVDSYNVRAYDGHHDGTNFYTFRMIKEGVNALELWEKIQAGKLSRRTIMNSTVSLRPAVREIYGF